MKGKSCTSTLQYVAQCIIALTKLLNHSVTSDDTRYISATICLKSSGGCTVLKTIILLNAVWYTVISELLYLFAECMVIN